MSTPNRRAGLPISVLPPADRQHVRLLELPPDLVALLAAPRPPRLQLKSRQDTTGNVQDAHVVLCTPHQTYNIRQVSTSNSVYLTQPLAKQDPGGGLPTLGVQAVAKCETTIELLSTSAQSAVPYIQATLPTLASTGNYGSGPALTKAELFAHIPLSQAECEEGWSQLACFECQDPPGCFIPSGRARAEIWQRAVTSATADGFNLTDPFPGDDLPAFATEICNDWPTELVASVLRSASTATPGGHFAIDETRAVRATGISLLQARCDGRAIEATGFLRAWRDLLPEAWRGKCEFAALHGFYALHDGGRMIQSIDTPPATAAAAASGAAATESKSLGAKRKWHQKFAAARKKT